MVALINYFIIYTSNVGHCEDIKKKVKKLYLIFLYWTLTLNIAIQSNTTNLYNIRN